MASADWMCNGHQATSQTTKVEVSPEGWRLKIQELVAEPHGRLRDITLEAHRDYTLPVASPERVALFGVILPGGTNSRLRARVFISNGIYLAVAFHLLHKY